MSSTNLKPAEIPLEPLAEYRIDVAQKLADAITLELKTRRLEKLVTAATDVLATNFTSPVFEGFEHVDVALGPIQKDMEETSEDLGRLRAIKANAIDELAIYTETSRCSLGGLSMEELLESAQEMVNWAEENRKHLIAMRNEGRALLRDKEQYENRRATECASIQPILDEMYAMHERVRRLVGVVDNLKRGRSQGLERSSPSSSTTMIEDVALQISEEQEEELEIDAVAASLTEDDNGMFSRLDDISRTLEAIRLSRPTFEAKISLLKEHASAALLDAFPLPPAVNTTYDMAALVDKIVAEEFPRLVSSFSPTFAEYRDSNEVYDHFVESMAEPNRLVLMVLHASPEYIAEDGEVCNSVDV